MPLADNIGSDAIAVRLRSANHFYYHNGTEFVAYPDNGINKTQGGTFFILNNTLYAVEPIGTNYLDGFQVVDIANNKVLANHATQITASPAYSPNANCISAQVTGNYEAKLYQYVPGQLAAQYTFKLDTQVGIENVAIDQAQASIYMNGDILTIAGITPNEIYVYSAAGSLVANEHNVQTVNLSTLPAGIYVVNITDNSGNTTTAKIAIK